MAECGAENMYLSQIPAPSPPPPYRNKQARTQPMPGGNMKFSDGNSENLPFRRPRHSRQLDLKINVLT
jgi:hypothetical protein